MPYLNNSSQSSFLRHFPLYLLPLPLLFYFNIPQRNSHPCKTRIYKPCPTCHAHHKTRSIIKVGVPTTLADPKDVLQRKEERRVQVEKCGYYGVAEVCEWMCECEVVLWRRGKKLTAMYFGEEGHHT
jgi:hypothetical protein